MRAARVSAIVVGAALLGCLGAAIAPADNGPPPPPTSPPPFTPAQLKAAQQACAAKGITINTPAFAQCVGQILNPGKPGPPPTSTAAGPPPTATTPAQKASQQCLAQGLKQGSPQLAGCVQRLLMSPKQQAAYDTCVAQGKTGKDLTDCVSALLQAGAGNPPLTPRQQDDVDYCLGLGKVQGTPDFIACIKTAGNRTLTPAQQAAVDECQSKGLTGDALAKCVSDLLTVKVPPKNGAGPSPASVQAAFDACLKKGLKPPSDAFQKCVKTALANP